MIRDIVLFLEDLLSLFGTNVYVQAAMAVLIAFVVAIVVDGLIRLIKRLTAKTSTRLDDLLIDALHQPIFVTIMLIGLGAATLLLQMPEMAEFVTVAILRTILTVVWFQFLIKLCRFMLRLVGELPGRRIIQPATLPLFDNLVLLGLIALAIYTILQVWSVDITAWVASAGIVGLALSFAAKDTLANLFAGVFILADAPYRVGDYVVLDSGERGKVTHIGIRSTRLLTRDDVEVTIPNAIMGGSKIVNEAGGPMEGFRIRIPIGVAYGSDVDQVRAVLMEIARSTVDVCEEPAPRVRFRNFGDWSLDFELLCWVPEAWMRGKVSDQLNMSIYKRFNSDGIEFPFPRQDITVRPTSAPNPYADSAGGPASLEDHSRGRLEGGTR